MERNSKSGRGGRSMVKQGLRLSGWLFLSATLVGLAWFVLRSFKVTETRQTIGTRVEITVLSRSQSEATRLVRGAFEEINRLERVFSDRLPDSELSLINRSAKAEPILVSREMGEILDHAFYWHERSGGRFDITIGTLEGIWGFKGQMPDHLPDRSMVADAVENLGMDNLQWDHAQRTLWLKRDGIRLDLGGIAKLEILLKLREYFESAGQHKYLVNLGGDVLAGQRGELVKWKIGISDPDHPDQVITRVVLEDSLVLTSGDYFRHHQLEGKEIHHILDPETGYPFDKIQALTLVMPANYPDPPPSVAAFVMGKDKALALIEALPMVEGLIYSEGCWYRSSGFHAMEVE